MRSLLALVLLTSPVFAQKTSLKHGATVTALAFSPDGKTLASGGQDQTIRLWNLAGGESRELRGHDGSLTSLTYSHDGKRLASAGRDGHVFIWDAVSGKLLRKLIGHERTVLGISFSPDGKYLASACYDRSVRLWDVESGQSLCQIEAHTDAVSCISFAPDGKMLATGSHDAFVKLWTVARDGKSLHLAHTLRESRRGEVTGLGFCMNGRLLASVTPHGTVRLRDPSRGEELRFTTIDLVGVLTLACSADGRTLAVAGRGGDVGLCEVATGKLIHRQPEPAARTNDLAFSPLEGYVGEVRAVALSSTGLTAAIGTKDGEVLVRDVGRLLIGKQTPERLTAKDLEALWKDLRDGESSLGYRAVALLAARPEQSLPFLKERLRVVEQPDPVRIEKLIGELDSSRFAIREKAAAELEKVLDMAEGLMRRRLENQPSLELRRRIERMLQPLDEHVAPPDRLRLGRALQALERIGSPAAQELLEKLSRGCLGAWLTEESRLALARLRLTN